MDEYAALAQRVVLTMGDVQGCLVLSRDGLVLAAFPEEAEPILKPAWLRFVAMGEIRKSFVEFSDQLWGFVHRGPYAAFVIAGVGVRPGVLLDQLEQALLSAEEGRTKRDAVKLPDAAAAPSGKPRTSLHPPADKPAPADVVAAVPLEPAALEAAPPVEMVAPVDAVAVPIDPAAIPIDPTATPLDPVVETSEAVAEAPAEAPSETRKGKASGLKKKPEKLMSSGAETGEEEPAEIDRVLLAKEFSGLLQLDSDGDEGSS
jgi:hypothetical protein